MSLESTITLKNDPKLEEVVLIWTARLIDIVIQLNYHSVHHRAQMQAIVRAQGIEPDFIDYIGTVFSKIKA